MTRQSYTGPGAAGSFGNDPESAVFLAELAAKAAATSLRTAKPRPKPARHSARLRIELDVDCPGDPRALVAGMLREYRATIPAWRWLDE
jgi:hypothetical protein